MGMNFRMTDLQLAVGVAQVERFEDIAHQKQRNFDRYRDHLVDIDEVKLMGRVEDSNFVPFRTPVRVENLSELIDHLEAKGISTRRFFYPLHRQPWTDYLEYNDEEFPATNPIYQNGMCLPAYDGTNRQYLYRD
jgi:perosamine synthetase